MSEEKTAKQAQIIKIGPDRITIGENEVIIEAKHRIEDWQVRELNPLPVYFNDKKYYLVEARKAQKPFAVSYVLLPWFESLTSNAKGFHTYDAEVVAERGAIKRSGQFEDVARAFLIPFYPLLGLFWSGVQRRLSRFGFVPHAITGISIFIVFCMIFAEGIFAIVTINGSMRSGKIMIGGFLRAMSNQNNLEVGSISIPIGFFDCLLVLVLLADVVMRYGYYMHEHDWAGGILEWMVRRPGMKTEAEANDQAGLFNCRSRRGDEA